MQIDVQHKPAYALAVCRLETGEQIQAESGAMVSMSHNIAITTQTGGVGKSLKRALLGGESLFMNTFTANQAPGEVTLAPTLTGDIERIALNGGLFIQSSSYLASAMGIAIDTQFKGLRGLFSGEGMFMLKAEGAGELLISCFGALHKVEVDGEYVVDTGHVVAFEPGLDYKIGRVGGWVATLFSGEGLISRFHGKGALWLQSRNPQAFGTLLGHRLPPRG